MKKEEAIKSGAECMFIEKYPDIVTVYSIGVSAPSTPRSRVNSEIISPAWKRFYNSEKDTESFEIWQVTVLVS